MCAFERSEKGMELKMEIITIDVEDEKYPQRLLKTKNFPIEIYAIGNIQLLNAKYTIGIVGTRKCTEYGRRAASEFAKEMSAKEICVISGLAMGIDGIAHNVAIEEQGKTIAVLGCGLNYIYPLENEWLFHKIIEKGGCIISEYPPNVEPDKTKFPVRNRIISGISDAVLVVEANYRSGSSITAKYAKEAGKVVYAIPNTIYASEGIGTNRLIREGAVLVTKPEQIIENIKLSKNMSTSNANIENVLMPSNKEEKGKRRRLVDNSKKSQELAMQTLNNSEQQKGQKVNLLNEMIDENTTKDEIRKVINKDSNKNNISNIMPKEYLQVYRALSNEPLHINELARKLEKSMNEVMPIITMLEIEGYAYQPQTNYFMRNMANGEIEEQE